MIPYHGTPLGGRNQEKPAFLRGRHALVPFSEPRDIEIVAECCQSFCLTVFHRFPFASVDSTNVAQNSGREANRHRTSEHIAREIIAERIESHNSASQYVARDQQRTIEFV